jgi:phospholipid/cholesterol/gamma-HCH transport system substrate-binding protein
LSEVKVGIFVLLSIAGFLAVSVVLNSFELFKKKGIEVTFVIGNANGVVPKSKIKFMGVQVGTVNEVHLTEDGVEVFAVLVPEFSVIPDNIIIVVNQDGLIGEKYIDLTLSAVETPSDTYLKQGGRYDRYKQPISMDDITEKIDQITDQVKEFTTSLNDFVNSETGNIREIIGNMNEAVRTLNTIVQRNEQTIGEIVDNIRGVTGTLETALGNKDKEINDIVENFAALSDNLKRFSEDLEALMRGEKDNISQSLANIRNLTDNASVSIDNLNKITTDAYEGKGTIGMLLADNETRDKLKETINSLADMATKANSLVVEIETGFESLTAFGDYRGRFDVRLRPNDRKFYLAGVSNNPLGTSKNTKTYIAGTGTPGVPFTYYEEKEEIRESPLVFSLQYAMLFNGDMFTVRGGLFDSRLGFALDYKPFESQKLYLTMEASDFYRDRYGTYGRANLKYYFLDHFFVQAGWDDMFSGSRSGFTVGGGITFIDDDLKYIISSVPMPSMP